MAIDGKRHVGKEPAFDPQEYFNGQIKAWGFIQDRSGNVQARFDAIMHGSWDGDSGTLEETFTYYDSGNVQERTWNIRKVDDEHYEATATDVIGKAKGRCYGNAIVWRYEMEVPVGEKRMRFRFEDWIWAMKDGVAINRSYFRKFGITVAELTVFMQRQ